MKQTGIWLDFKEANIIQVKDNQVITKQVLSNIEHFNIKGGSRSKTPYGPMENVSESKYMERNKQQIKRYYEGICKEIEDADELFIMGPAEAKVGLLKFIEDSKSAKTEVLDVQTVDSMTLNQKIAKVKEFFVD